LWFLTDIGTIKSELEFFAGVHRQILVNWTRMTVDLVPGFEIMLAVLESQGKQAEATRKIQRRQGNRDILEITVVSED
jgi:predicted ATPase